MENLTGLTISRTIVISGDFNGELTSRVLDQLAYLEAAGDSPIVVLLNSCGGELDEGTCISNAINACHAPVYVVGVGCVRSTAAYVLIFGQSGRRAVVPNASVVMHGVSIAGEYTSIEHAKSLLEIESKNYERLLRETSKRIKMSYKELSEKLDDEIWLTGKQALRLKMADMLWTSSVSRKIYHAIRASLPGSSHRK